MVFALNTPKGARTPGIHEIDTILAFSTVTVAIQGR
jgi:hypothetical protein